MRSEEEEEEEGGRRRRATGCHQNQGRGQGQRGRRDNVNGSIIVMESKAKAAEVATARLPAQWGGQRALMP